MTTSARTSNGSLPWRRPVTPSMTPLFSISLETLEPIQHRNDGNRSALRNRAARNTGCGIQIAYGYSGEILANDSAPISSPPTRTRPASRIEWGCASMYSSRPSSSSRCAVLGCSTSPRNSRSKVSWPSSTSTSAPRLASSSPRSMPAGPPPTMHAFTRTVVISSLPRLLSPCTTSPPPPGSSRTAAVSRWRCSSRASRRSRTSRCRW